jgi:hypothetical protein
VEVYEVSEEKKKKPVEGEGWIIAFAVGIAALGIGILWKAPK